MKKITLICAVLSLFIFSCNQDEDELSCSEIMGQRLFEFDCSLSPVRVEVFTEPEQLASFPGCGDLPTSPERYQCTRTKFDEYIAQNMNSIPDSGMGNGYVVAYITIERDGCISSMFVRDDQGCGCDCTREAVRLVGSMPDWVPAKNGEATVASEQKFFIYF